MTSSDTHPDRSLIDAVGEALEREPGERGAFLAEWFPGRPDLLGAARRMLAVAERAESGPDPADSFRIRTEWLEWAARELEPRFGPGISIGRFRIRRFIAAGGMGEVYEAEDSGLGRHVAVKILQAAGGPRRSQRFLREASLLARLEHPAIVRLYEWGVAEVDGDEVAFMAMEFVDGRPLAEAIGDGDARAVVSLLLPVVDAVAYAHSRGVLHRDLKPGNVLVDREGRARLLDFGVATVVEDSDGLGVSATGALSMPGTLAYMSPEQLRGGSTAVTTQSDVYGLGLILHEAVAGRPIVTGEEIGVAGIVRRILDEPLPSLGSLRPAARGDLEAIVAAALARETGDRYASAAALGSDLRRYLAGEPPLVRPPGTFVTVRTLVRRHRRGIAVAAAIGAVALAGAALAAVQFLRAREAEARSDLLVGQLVEGSRPMVLELPRILAERDEPLSARKAALEAALAHLAWIRAVAGEDERVLEAVARAHAQLGQVVGSTGRGSLGDVEGAAAAFREARSIYEGLLARRPTESLHRSLSDVIALEALRETGERKAELLAEAAAEYRRALALMPPGQARDLDERVILVRELYASVAAGDADGIRARIASFAALEPRWRDDAEYWSEVGLAWRYLTQVLEADAQPGACEAAEACRVALERSNALGLAGNFSNERHLARSELSEVACSLGRIVLEVLEERALAALKRSRRAWMLRPADNFHRMSHAETVRQFGDVAILLAASLAEPERSAFGARSAQAMGHELDLLAATPVEGEPHPREGGVIAEVEGRIGRLEADPGPP